MAAAVGGDGVPAEVTTYIARGIKYRHPRRFRLDPKSDHKGEAVLNDSDTGFLTFCLRDGAPWPCPVVQRRRDKERRQR